MEAYFIKKMIKFVMLLHKGEDGLWASYCKSFSDIDRAATKEKWYMTIVQHLQDLCDNKIDKNNAQPL